MRNLTLLLFALIIVSCGNQKKLTGEAGNTSISIFHQWKLTSIAGETIDAENMTKVTQITFTNGEDRFFGNDGCNNISGGFEINENDLKFGPIMGTKMACMDMRIPDLFGQTLANVSSYETKELISGESSKNILQFLDKDGHILMQFEMME